MFLQKLDHLSLALAANQDAHPDQEATQLLQALRRLAGEQSSQLFSVTFLAGDFSRWFLRLLDSLSKAPTEEKTQSLVKYVSGLAADTAKGTENAHKEMTKFGRGLAAAVEQLQTGPNDGEFVLAPLLLQRLTLLPDNHNSRNSLFNTENSQAVNDLVHAISECNTLLAEVAKYYREMEQHLSDADSVKLSTPTQEEIDIIRQRWTGFSESIVNLRSEMGTIRIQLVGSPLIDRVEDVPESLLAGVQLTVSDPPPTAQGPSTTSKVIEPMAIQDNAEASSSPAPVTAPASGESPKSWRSFFRRLFQRPSFRRPSFRRPSFRRPSFRHLFWPSHKKRDVAR